MIRVVDDIAIDEREVHERFVRAAGARGQNARREATAVELRFDINASLLPLEVKERLRMLAGRTVTSEGVLIVMSRANKSLEDNRKAARVRLLALLERAVTPPAERTPTLPRPDARESRLATKKRRAAVKALRSVPRSTSRA